MAATFPFLGNLDNIVLKGYSDASLVNLSSRNSAGAGGCVIISLVVENNKSYPLEMKKTALFDRYYSFC